MRLDRVEYLVHRDCLDLLSVFGDFNEDVGVKVVIIVGYILPKVSKKVQDIHALLKCLRWQVRRDDINVELVLCQDTHMLVGLPVVRRQSCHFIEDLTKVMLYFL